MDITFLKAGVPLTKTISKTSKDPYPLIKNFTSIDAAINTPVELYNTIKAHAKLGHCMLKGTISRALSHEPRAGTTRTDDETEWVCLDFDRFETVDIDDQLTAMGLSDVTYILQYSSSHGLDGNEGTTSAHVFMLLDAPVRAPMLKSWLMGLNLTLFRDELRLSRDKNQLSWPLDITTCQNDKLLYIATPKFVGIKDPVENRLQLIGRPLHKLPVERIGERHIDALKADARKALNELRVAEGLKARTAGTSWVGSTEIQNKPNQATVTGIKDCGEYVRLNLNGGDSWAYWHHKDDFEIIRDYKTDGAYKTKELLPGYYGDLVASRAELNSSPNEDGDLILAFRDLKTANYYNGLWNPAQQHLEIYKAKNETQLDHWCKSHGRHLGDFIPVWDIQYNPRADWVVDEDRHAVNTFQKSEFMRMEPHKNKKWTHIEKIICHMMGEAKPGELTEHFINWFACVFQRQHKPLTAWVFHGVEGTGKGYFINKIASKLLGKSNAISVTVSNIEDNFNGFLDGKLLVFVDEVDVDDFREKGRITARFRNYITEPTMLLREMRATAIDVPNYVSFIFSSNRPQPVFIPPTDRRYNVGNFQGSKLPPPNDEQIDAELAAFAEFLLAYKVDQKKADTVMETEARQHIQKLSVTSLVETCQHVLSGDLESLWLARPDERLLAESGVINPTTINAQAYVLLMDRIAEEALNEAKNVITRDELLVILQYNVGAIPSSPNKLTSLLRHNGINTRRIRKHNQLTYGMEVEWKIPDWLCDEIKSRTKGPSRKSNLRVAK